MEEVRLKQEEMAFAELEDVVELVMASLAVHLPNPLDQRRSCAVCGHMSGLQLELGGSHFKVTGRQHLPQHALLRLESFRLIKHYYYISIIRALLGGTQS